MAILAFFSIYPLLAEDTPYRPTPGTFADPAHATPYWGELVFVDHVNRRGTLRLHIDGYYREDRLHHFAMLPYGEIYYRGAPAELRDIPIGTNLYGQFYLPPDPETSVVPVVKNATPGRPTENHAILLEDAPSRHLRQSKTWQLKELTKDKLIATLADDPETQEFTIDASTRFWRGRESLTLADVSPDPGTPLYLCLGWHERYLYQQFHVADVFLDQAALDVASEQQRQTHIRHIRHRWLPARIDSCEHGKFGKASIVATLFGGMDESLYAAFQPGERAKMAVAEATLRTWWQNHDGMDGKIAEVTRSEGKPQVGDSGIQITFEMPLILEGFRPGMTVRIRHSSWVNAKPPLEEQVKGFDDRWPSREMFTK